MTKWDFRDVSLGIKKIREFLLGRKFVYHQRFPPTISPRSIPKPDVPRGPEYKYSAQYYGDRDALNSVKPPVVAPIAEGLKMGYNPWTKFMTGGHIKFPSELPTPGCVWWFDAHCYYKEVNVRPCAPSPPDQPCVKLSPKSICKEPAEVALGPQDPCAKKSPCDPDPCEKLQPCKVEKPPPPKLPEEPCDPCKPKS